MKQKCFNCGKKVPLRLVLLDNFPTALLIGLGFFIIFSLSPAGALFFLVYSVFSIIWFWGRICPVCHFYNTYSCPCGYGKISALFFKKQENKSFQKIFKQNIPVLFPLWFVPPAIGIYRLIISFSFLLLCVVLLFSLIGFIVIPLVSRLVGCKNCSIKEECPWMKSSK